MLDYSKFNKLVYLLRTAPTRGVQDHAEENLREYFAELFRTRVFLPVTLDRRCFRCGGAMHLGRCATKPDPFIEWVEPLGRGSEPVYMRARASDVAKVARALEPRYESDEQAVEDFMVIHWAHYVSSIYDGRGAGPDAAKEEEKSEAAVAKPDSNLQQILQDLYDHAYRHGHEGKYAAGREIADAANRIQSFLAKSNHE
jgi:hypothetical protein